MKIPASLSRYRTTLIVVITLVVGLFLGRALFGGAASPAPMSEREGHDMKDQIWTCSMHPQIRMKQPGQCPICGMDLIPAASGDAEMDPMTVGLTEHAMKLANVRTMIVGMGYSDGQIVDYVTETPKVPTILHLGKTDELIPPTAVAAIRETHPDLPVFMYEAGHAFVAPNGFNADSARLSHLRTLQLFSRNSGVRSEM